MHSELCVTVDKQKLRIAQSAVQALIKDSIMKKLLEKKVFAKLESPAAPFVICSILFKQSRSFNIVVSFILIIYVS